MRIKTRLSLIFASVLMFILLIISSYSILFIRDYLEQKAINEALSHANSIALNIRAFDNSTDAERYLLATASLLGTQVVLIDGTHKIIWASHAVDFSGIVFKDKNLINDINGLFLGAYAYLEYNKAKFVVILQSKRAISEDLMPIRYIIYSGMLLSLSIIILVSIFTARSFSRPISSLASSAEEIAAGNFDKQLILNRKDEFGALAESLNSMASTLKKESEDLRNTNRKQKQFYADIAHEIKNPMHTMMGSMEILSMENLTDEHRKKYVEMIKNQAQRVYKLFEDLVTLQKYDSYDTKLHITTFPINDVVKRIAQSHEILARNKNLTLQCSVGKHKVIADESKIAQVLDNLISNAIKNTKRGGVTISSESDSKMLTLFIKDTGVGMTPDEIEHIFDRFYRTDASRSRDSGGSGLGLAIAKSILVAHGTDINVDSKKEEGSTFSFALPIET